ncbi:MAG TPA: hypothetical protein VH877_21715 [Polyangia bacterium]|nr:hypothetical protein [Polyangia bacterium]
MSPSSMSMTDGPAEAAPEGTPRQRRQLRNLLLDTRFQLRFTLMMVGISAVLTAGLGALTYHFVREASRVALIALDPNDPLGAELAKSMQRNDQLLLVALVAFGVVLALVMTGYGLRLTHTVAGPLYKISNLFREIRDGRLPKLRPLRKGDQLQAFFATYREMHEALAERTQEEIRALDELIAESERAGQRGMTEQLRALKQKKEGFLG